MVEAGNFPVVLGGDDSVLFGCGLALRRLGTAGLVLLDGHTDFWNPRNGSGELSDSDLWLATGPRLEPCSPISKGRGPLFDDRCCVVYGHRDRDGAVGRRERRRLRDTRCWFGTSVSCAPRAWPPARAHARAFLASAAPDRVWLHLDADCLHDDVMPAVDWRQPDGLLPDEVVELARPLMTSGCCRRHGRDDLQPEPRHRRTCCGVTCSPTSLTALLT